MVPYGHEIRKIVIKDRTSLAATLLELLSPCRGVLVKGGSGLFVGNELPTTLSRWRCWRGGPACSGDRAASMRVLLGWTG